MKCRNCHSENPDDSRFCGNCGKPLVDIPTTPPTAAPTAPTQHLAPRQSVDFKPGQHFGSRYQIIEVIGRGGMGVVYKAIDREISRVVALKMIRPELSSDPEVVEQFKRELILAREISHENVIRIHDLGEQNGIRYISMKYIEGTNLRDLLTATGRLTQERVISIAAQICSALDAAHRKGVIHRDLKPQNIMVDRGGEVHVMDFGIARSLEGGESGGPGKVTGTPSYMSPEQAQGQAGDARSDIYSLGCILFEMLTGRKVFERETAHGLMTSHIEETPSPPSRLNPAVSAALDRLILKTLEKEPVRRFQTAGELCLALTDLMKKDQVPAKQMASGVDRGDKQAAPAAATSIAVLPFRDMSPQKDQEYFCDGMAEEIINALVRIEGLRVAALTSAFQFKNQSLDVREIGGQLNVGTVLEGSVRKAGNRLRVTAQLVNVVDGYHIWSERYDRDLEDVFEIQDDISTAIVRALEPRLIEGKRRPPARREVNLEAYNLYLKGRYHWNKRDPNNIAKGIEYFNRALEIDPGYALAYAGLADCYLMAATESPRELYARAGEAARKALELDSTLAEPHTSLALILGNSEYNWDEAEREFRKSIDKNPNYATAHQWYALGLSVMGRFEEAFSEIEIAKQLDPLSLIIKAGAGWVSYAARRYERAIAEAEGALEMDPDFLPAHALLGAVLLVQGRLDEAFEHLSIDYGTIGDGEYGERIARAYKEDGKEAALREIVNCMEAADFPYGYAKGHSALVLVRLGEFEKALDYLEQAYEHREQELGMLMIEPDADPIRAHPRFKALLRKMNIPDMAS